MQKTKATSSPAAPRKMRPALDPDAREGQLICLAMDAAEQQLMAGTASSQVITHFLKLGSTRERIEMEIMEKQKEMIEAKTQALQSTQHIEELYTKAMTAMRSYSGQEGFEDGSY